MIKQIYFAWSIHGNIDTNGIKKYLENFKKQ